MALASPGRVGGLWVLSHSYLHDLDEFQKQPLPVLGLLLQHDDGTYPAGKARQATAELPVFHRLGAPGGEICAAPVPVATRSSHLKPKEVKSGSGP